MRREIIAAASVLALMTGTAMAQTTSPTTGSPTTGAPTATEMNKSGNAPGSAATGSASGLTGGQMASAENMMGKNVYGTDNEKVGEVEDIILDGNGQAQQLVISSGGFLGIGEKQIAVDIGKANWDAQQERVQLSGMTRDQVKEMPEFEYSDTTTSLNRNKDKAGDTVNGAASRSSTGTSGTMTAPGGATGTPPAAPSGTGQ
ncbi:PRC-barrel domain-containing protein [Azospirillum sp. YIM DDC1]|uniref:PRC-barrel domain-containing protein n=1 Tax=Azospirillum aestuarii TaxID=2802052 RepID=A0ABS1HYY4_9PROT|nr:PRC-barrel domain-containing protein [Azospirillum aestuarii]MBK4720021.1 PRC-barrel domain-containing protein [Azospirillum aestuarii]TWA89806.1 sporulation protein YlmC with PRC-barrel domain [Azospirillum brasilense]